MRRAIAALLLGELLLFIGLWMAWPPLALVIAGGQVIAVGVLSETTKEERA